MRSLLLPYVLAVTLAGCPGGDAAIGETCSSNGDCSSELQCLSGVCQPRCEHAPECGDGYRCDSNGLCQPATGEPGDACTSEVDCGAGLSCQITGTVTNDDGYLAASCVSENSGRPVGAVCAGDNDCRNGTCDLGHCEDLCNDTRDCAAGSMCSGIPRVAANGLPYRGCVPANGTLTFQIPVHGPDDIVGLPIPDTARGVSVLFSVDDQNQKVGATSLTSPSGMPLIGNTDPAYGYYENPFVRHKPEYGQSVLAMPSTSASSPLEPGLYTMRVRSLHPGINSQGQPEDKTGTATPTMTAVLKMDSSVILDLHFYFLNLDDHPCSATFAGKLDATVAQTASFFQTDFITQLRTIFAQGGIANGAITYEDLRNHPDLDGLDIANAGSLMSLGTHTTGINVFFVRTLSPVGIQALGPNPGPAGLAGTRQSGIVIGVDTLCYRDWKQLARITAHELALYMGLYHNIELDPNTPSTTHEDWIPDSVPDPSNLMFYSELGGSTISEGQRYILSRSPVLR